MKISKLFTSFLAFVSLGAIVGCGQTNNDQGAGDSNKPVLQIHEIAVKIEKFEGLQLTYDKKNIEGDITWTSSDEEIATVNPQGYVYGVSAGECTVTLSCGDLTSTCNVEITTPTVAATLYVESKTITMINGDSVDFEVYAMYKAEKIEPEFEYILDTEGIVSYSYSNYRMTLTALSEGTVKLTFSANVRDTLLIGSIDITVENL